MHREEQDVLIFRKTQQLSTKQRAVLKIEGAAGFGLCKASDFVGLCKRVQLDKRQREFEFGSDVLHGLTVVLNEGSAQAFMTRDEYVQCGLEGPNIECAA
ncbi:hypothetical protein AWB76_07854 [Caballeronia temeraria]|uniref:Uncharacterized protein n=1 Tax=Caballeronia temeraria TaxID=1777137 RepID=A0A158E0M4_9BURK|nr:hypothetical protein AWB76_07854 [Caballeronia temeraria]